MLGPDVSYHEQDFLWLDGKIQSRSIYKKWENAHIPYSILDIVLNLGIYIKHT